MRTRWFALAVTLLCLGAPPVPATARQADAFVGVWTLNHDLTPPPPAADRERPARAGSRQGRMAGRGGGMRGGPGGGGFERPNEDDRLRLEAVMRRLRDVPERLTITHDGAEFAFASDAGRTWSARVDGEKVTRLTGDGEIVSKARFEHEALVIEEAVKDSPTLVFTYTPFDDHGLRRLKVTVAIEGRRGREAGGESGDRPGLTRIYDRSS
ncbi:MAG: hypothetical protein AB7O67_02645 [Vicinamibacterales bacterium]